MEKTEKKYWVNGHQVRGGFFHTFNFSIFNIGMMISYGCAICKNGTIHLNFYKLI